MDSGRPKSNYWAKKAGAVFRHDAESFINRLGLVLFTSRKLSLYTDCWRDRFLHTDTADWIAGAYDEAHASSLLDRTLYADHVTYLSGDLLPKTDRMTMARSLEARSPFFDVEWVEWTARLPERLKVRRMSGKWLLKAAFGELLPPAICARGKQGFGVPVGLWLKNELRDWARECLLNNGALTEWFRPPRFTVSSTARQWQIEPRKEALGVADLFRLVEETPRAVMFSIFDFGANWEEFSKRRVDRRRLEMACESLQSLLEKKSLAGKSFLDVGCGRGFSRLQRINSVQRKSSV